MPPIHTAAVMQQCRGRRRRSSIVPRHGSSPSAIRDFARASSVVRKVLLRFVTPAGDRDVTRRSREPEHEGGASSRRRQATFPPRGSPLDEQRSRRRTQGARPPADSGGSLDDNGQRAELAGAAPGTQKEGRATVTSVSIRPRRTTLRNQEVGSSVIGGSGGLPKGCHRA